MATQPAAPTWASKDPADMSVEELKAARASLQAAVDEAQQALSLRATALNRVTATIGKMFDMVIPGIPPLEAVPEYPLADIAALYGVATQQQ